MESTYNINPFLQLRDITVDYNELRALSNVHLDIFRGQIHAIIGEHGAGKSSLAQIMSGSLNPASGNIVVGNKTSKQLTLRAAQAAGIRMVYQETYLNDKFSVAENLFYTSRESTHMGLYSRKRVEENAGEYLHRYGFEIDPRAKLRTLSLTERTIIDILKNIYTRPNLLILDEALEKLSTDSFSKIVSILTAMRKQGMAIVSITHRIDDVYRIADKVSVIKSGKLLLTEKVKNINMLNLIRMAYTQVETENNNVQLDTEFYQFIKYNEAILQHLPVNIIVIDEMMKIRMVNQHCIKSFSLAEKKYINTHIESILAGNKNALTLIEKSISSRSTKTFYNVELLIQNTQSINNIKTFPVFDGFSVIGTIVIIEDMTEYDRLQKQLILSDKLASVGLLAAGVAHEINNPLEIISNYLSFIKYTFSDLEISGAIDKVNNEIDYISRIVSNLLTFSGHHQQGFEIVDLNEVTREILGLLKYNAKYQHIQILFKSDFDQVCFMGDHDQIKQVILNLIKNSFEAMESGGKIQITTSEKENDTEHHACLIFEDTGPGINPENMTNIFLPFFSTKSAAKNQLGLGLSISYRIIESFGGEMRVKNLPAGGCRFEVRLPSAAHS